MQLRLFKLRFRRRIKQRQKQVEGLGQQAEQTFDRHVFRRLNRLANVRRFVIGWVGLLLVLICGVLLQNFNLSNYYQALGPVPGGIYREGILGTFSTANPLYATSEVDTTVARLVFASLFFYDQNNQLSGDLASGYEVDEKGLIYTVHLKPHLTWQDGQPLTSADVLFTYQAIQNPDAQSPLRNSWQGIAVSAPDASTVVFKLPGPLASFPQNMINGIVPEHILAKVHPADLRTADFNTLHPMGAGPFAWRAIEVNGKDPSSAQIQLALVPFDHYHGGRPKLDQFVVHAYANQQQLIDDFARGQLRGLAGLSSLPPEVKGMSRLQTHNLLLTAGTYTFFKTTHPILGSQKVRQALVQSVDQLAIIHKLPYISRPVKGPLLPGQLANDPNLAQPKFDMAAAKALLDQDGWVVGKQGTRSKGGKPLAFTLVAANTPEYRSVINELQKQWKQLGVTLRLRLLTGQDFQNALAYHDYDAVLYGISIGTDPDVFVYWDSTQADIRSANRLNLSEYNNSTADAALEAGRTRLDPVLRTVKYRPFLQAWQQDLPALGLYQPRVLYLTNGPVAGLADQTINTSTERFNNVQNWKIRQAKVTNQ